MMRLGILEHGHRLTQKLFFRMLGLQTGHVPAPICVLTYRRNWFGAMFVDCLSEGLRESTAWSVGEAELFATFISKINRCEY